MLWIEQALMFAADHLPSPPGPFIGRQAELAEIAHLLSEPACRLLTLVGPGGSGKTRLAVQAAAAKASAFENGVHFVPLVQLGSVDHILPAIVSNLGLHTETQETLKQQLFDYLRPRQLLLVLDNFEHLLDGADLLAELLRVAPRLKILTTSRETLKLQEEWVRHVAGLPFPADHEAKQLDEFAAVQLFIECARRVRGDFSLLAERGQVIHICQLVEGLPLGIELAAAWLRTLTASQIAREIQHNIDFLSTPMRNVPERHRSLRAVFEHSLRLLQADEQAVFAKLSVFRGGFTQQAAQAVSGASLQMLSALVDKSLVRLHTTERYDLHELLRQFGAEKLGASGTADQTGDAHCAYYLGFVQALRPDIKGSHQVEALAALDADFENIRVAWQRAVEQKHYAAIDGALETLSVYSSEDMHSDASPYLELLRQTWERLEPSPGGEAPPILWHIRAHYYWLLFRSDEAKTELERCLEEARREENAAQEAFCLTALGHVSAFTYKNYQGAVQCLEESIVYYREVKDTYHLARNLGKLSMCLWMLGRTTEFDKLFQQSYVLSRETGDKARIGQALQTLAINAAMVGDMEHATQLFQEALEVWREMGFQGAVANTNAQLSLFVPFSAGDMAAAKSLAQAALKLARDTNYRDWGVCMGLHALASVLCVEEDYVGARRLLEESGPLSAVNPVMSGLQHWSLAMTACGLGNYPAAGRSLSAALDFGTTMVRRQLLVWCLPVAAILDAHAGQPQRAVEQLALASTFPASLNGWMDKWSLLNRLRAALVAELGEEMYAQAWRAGQELTLEPVIAALSTRYRQARPPIRQPIPDPLTERELEVLRLIADGRSNREIAEQLVVGMSTVSKHINHLYSKLAVTARMQAVVRARELGLL